MTKLDSTKLTYICEACGKPFPDNKRKNRFCSYSCARAKSTAVDKTCEYCNQAFTVNKSRDKEAKYCSKKCAYADKHVWFTCEQCGQTSRQRRHWVEGKKKRRFCSYTCAAKWQKLDNHSNWKGGLVKWRGPNWQQQKNKARKRDKHTCQECGIKESELGRPLDVHHIKPWREFNFADYMAANHLDNLICYCPRCHTTIERSEQGPTHTRTIQEVQGQLQLDLRLY